jgi:hypothetical protein
LHAFRGDDREDRCGAAGRNKVESATTIPLLKAGDGPLRNLLCNSPSRGCRRQRLAIALQRFQPFIDDLAQVGIHFRFITAVATRSNDARALADKTLVLIGPFHDLDVSSTAVHDRDSFMGV